MVTFEVTQRGVHRVALSAGAWIEVVRHGNASRSVGHGHGPDCSGIRKVVDFGLAPGSYMLQLTASDATEVTVMIVAAASASRSPR